MKKTFVMLVMAFVLSVASSAWGFYIYYDGAEEGTVGEEYSAAIRYADWYGIAYTTNWSYTGDFPPGLKFDDEGLGPVFITGIPTKAGSYTFSVTLVNDYYPLHRQESTKQFTINIKDSDSNNTGNNTGNNGTGNTGNNTGNNNNGDTGTGNNTGNNNNGEANNGNGNGGSLGSSGGGGGCNSSIGIIGLMLLGIALRRKISQH